MFKHKNCNGNIITNLGNSMRVVSPGIKITERGVTPGLTEVRMLTRETGISYLCSRCDKEFKTQEELSEILVRCDADDEWHSVNDVMVTESYMFCENCNKIVLGESSTSDEHLLHLREVLSIPSACRKIKLSSVMLKLVKS